MTPRERKWLRGMMAKHRLNQAGVAHAIGIGEDKVSKIMHDGRRLPLDEALKLCEAVGETLAVKIRIGKKDDDGGARWG